MIEPGTPPATGIAGLTLPSGERSAGAMLREARTAQGLHIAALAASIKVSQKKLEALEGDRYDELLDTTFVRALAQAVCRALKIDSAPILARLPQQPSRGLEQVAGGLNTTYRERSSRRDSSDWQAFNRPVVWGTLALLVAAAAVYLLPPGWFGQHFGSKPVAVSAAASSPSVMPASAPDASTMPAAETLTGSTAADGVQSAAAGASAPVDPAAILNGAPTPEPSAASAAAPVAASASGPPLTVQATTGPSWIEVQDVDGRTLISRTLAAGESVSLAGPPPLKVKIGNATVLQMNYRGQPVAFPPRATIVKMDLK